jgi:hypothetical protein
MLSEEQGTARLNQEVGGREESAATAAGRQSRGVEFWYTDLDESVSHPSHTAPNEYGADFLVLVCLPA